MTGYVHVIDPTKCQKCCYDHPVDTPCPPPPVVTTNSDGGPVVWVPLAPPTACTPPGELNTTSNTPAKTDTNPTGLKGEK